MLAFATVDDYVARYGDVDDPDRVAVLLSDASSYIASQPGFPSWPVCSTMLANLVRIACAVVHRSLSAGDLAGLSSYSETGIGYSANVSVSNPAGDFYLTGEERRLLFGRGGRIGLTCPYSVPEVVEDGQAR